MLTTETRRKIDNCRDSLVGKIPVPSAQIEQITLALIYKFMSDIDKQNEELGGASFFE
jgi:type I restriction enzyme M protein